MQKTSITDRAAALVLANKELAFQNEEKEKRAAELILANKELAFQNEEKEKRAAELIIANKELAYQNEEKEKRAAELILANKELAFQNEEKEKRAAELIIANKELAYQNEEKEKREAELMMANKELIFQNEEKEKRAAELIIANKELAFQNEEKEKRAEELITVNAAHAEKLIQSNVELEKYAYVASHDLQEPLRMVTGFLELLQKKYEHQLDETAQKYISFAVDGAARMKALIRDLLEFSRIRATTEDRISIDLNDVLLKTQQSLKTVIDEAEATIDVQSLPKIYGNESQLFQLFQNLISNAIKYRSPERPVVKIGYAEIPGAWEFYVEDNGIGIDQEFYEKIFIIFQRLHNRKEYEGTGIGLAICKKIVELHGGRIWVESSKNTSKFHFTISKNK